MPLASTDRLTTHFTAFELGADRPEATALIVANLRRTAASLEEVRQALGVPLLVNTTTSRNRGFRPPDANAAAGGVATSSHQDGLAADVVPVSFHGGMRAAYDRLKLAHEQGQLGPFDQIILYPIQGHIHVGLGPKSRAEFRVSLFEGQGGTPLVSADTIGALGAQIAEAVTAAGERLAVWVSVNPAVGVVLLAVVAVAVVSILST
jgi:hypothetical protein